MESKYVTDIEHSHRLVEAGWETTTLFTRYESVLDALNFLVTKSFPTPIADEIINELPPGKYGVEKLIDGTFIVTSQKEMEFYGDVLSNAFADLWVWMSVGTRPGEGGRGNERTYFQRMPDY